MSSPSPEHEARVRLLEAVAVLAGFTGTVAFEPPLEPDVFRVDFHRRRVFVGDAKATETTGAQATKARLARYARAARSWRDGGADVVLAVAHGQPRQAREWLDAVQEVAGAAGLETARAAISDLYGDCLLAWIYVSGAPTVRRGSSPGAVRLPLDAFFRDEAAAS